MSSSWVDLNLLFELVSFSVIFTTSCDCIWPRWAHYLVPSPRYVYIYAPSCTFLNLYLWLLCRKCVSYRSTECFLLAPPLQWITAYDSILTSPVFILLRSLSIYSINGFSHCGNQKSKSKNMWASVVIATGHVYFYDGFKNELKKNQSIWIKKLFLAKPKRGPASYCACYIIREKRFVYQTMRHNVRILSICHL